MLGWLIFWGLVGALIVTLGIVWHILDKNDWLKL